MREDLRKCDLLIVIGKSLQVHPFASLVDYVPEDTPRLLIYREAVGPFARLKKGRGRDAFWEGDADVGVKKMAEALGWAEELEILVTLGRKALEEDWRRKEGLIEALVGEKVSGEGLAVEVKKAVEEEPDGLDELQTAIAKQLNLV